MTTIGFIGSGKIGSALARKAVASGYDVVLSNSRGPETLADLVAELGPKARAATAAEAAAAADLAVVTVPFKAYESVPVAELAGKVVIDTTNYYFERDGHYEQLDAGEETSSGLLQKHLPTSHVVKAFNHIGSGEIPADSRPAGTADRRALAIYGDDAAANATVAALQDEIGFDTFTAGPLADSWRVQRDQPAYGGWQDLATIEQNLGKATR